MPSIAMPDYFAPLAASFWNHGSIVGVLVGVTLPELLLYPVVIWAVRRYNVWLPKLDFSGFALAIVLIVLGFML
jgi:hypothetical protein